MWPVLLVQFHFGVLMLEAGGDGEEVSLFIHPFPAQFCCSWMHLKGLIYTSQDHVSWCKCGQYWLHNFILEFWCFRQKEMEKELHHFYIHFLLNFGVLGCFWKVWFIAFRTMFHHINVANIGPASLVCTFDAWSRRRWGINLFIYQQALK